MRFTTINSDLFAKPKEASIPDWLQDMPTDFEKPTMDIEFSNNAAWAEKQMVSRDDRDYQPKELTAKLNNNEILYAKTELAKFLKNKHYSIKTATVKDDVITLTANISNVPGEFSFYFSNENNKVKLASTFDYNKEFYPFNQAGFNECLSNIDIHNPIAQKVETDKAAIISTEEIYRRYNGHIRQATDRINQLLKEGDIVGVGSNSFGTFLDVDYLFPQQEKETLSSNAPQFEFVANIEKTKVTEAKSAYQLAMEASKIFSNSYDDFKIKDYKRKDNTLYVKASVLSNNQTQDVNLKFDIVNEKVQNREMPRLASKTNLSQQHRIHKSNILKREHLASVLKNNGYFVNVDDVLNNLVIQKKINQVASDKYTTNYSINQLLDFVNLKQDTAKLAALTDKVEDLRLNREDIIDTGVREAEELVSEKTLLNAVNEFLIKYFDTYEIVYFNVSQDEEITFVDADVNVFDNTTGLELKMVFTFECEGNSITNYHIRFNGEDATIEDVQKTYDINQALVNYLDERTASKVKSNIVFSKQFFKDKLSRVAKLDVDKTLNLLVEQDKIQQIASDKYASKFTLEQLINISNVQALSKKQMQSNIEKAQINKSQKLSGIYTQDTLDREIVDVWSDNEIELYMINAISKLFTTFDIQDITKDTEVYRVALNAVDEDGLTKPMVVVFSKHNNHPDEILQVIKPDSNDAVQEYLQTNKPNLYNAKGILSQKQLENNLLDVIDVNEMQDVFTLLVENAFIEPIFADKYILNKTMSEIVSFLDKSEKVSSVNKLNRRKAVQALDLRDKPDVMDCDTREIEKENELTLAGKKSQQYLLKQAGYMYNNKKLTLKKYMEVKDGLYKAKTERELDRVAKILNEYK